MAFIPIPGPRALRLPGFLGSGVRSSREDRNAVPYCPSCGLERPARGLCGPCWQSLAATLGLCTLLVIGAVCAARAGIRRPAPPPVVSAAEVWCAAHGGIDWIHLASPYWARVECADGLRALSRQAVELHVNSVVAFPACLERNSAAFCAMAETLCAEAGLLFALGSDTTAMCGDGVRVRSGWGRWAADPVERAASSISRNAWSTAYCADPGDRGSC